MGLKDAVEKLNGIIDDLSSLHVQTFTGEVTFEGQTDPGDSDGESAKIETIRARVKELKNANQITLVAEAYYQFDGDSYNFLASGGISQEALDMHNAAVEAGIKTRQGLIALVQDVLTK